ncbi:enoyl-CoA hydratase/isomerase family protein [Aromatoleum toluolicum]|uniref:Crotonase n=1 Tax=Aromatoleum toluolicum TaxID=90060 RepID=A0ABX1NBG9_9RHOO|nr:MULTISPECIES: enoyl-CoA hydratase/isomerase family protein [Rhodocyclales]AKU14374.1 putative enoyl-CoA hydratase [Azoarcus sp. CIB]AYH45974.1 enoyl-CoA hydratase/isomerase family protein [Azoarcus sp. DN11]NMF96645.1 enoyl-CoA hydratase/isomerase family protein [Aromatoleum toluolicum]CCH23025.1 putative enoyl-CoA hydratase [Azoarcus sp. CIB]
MANEIVLKKRSDGIAIVTLNRPEAMNAINRAMVRKLRDAIRDVESDEAVDVIIVAGSGGKAFCVGIDLKERQTLSDEEAAVLRLEEMFPMYSEFEAKRKPSIAVVDGHCLAGGFEIALACDLIFATPRSTFGLPEVKWGLIPAAGGCRKLPKLIGAARAKELILTASTFDAVAAERMGVINRIVSGEELMPQALEMAQCIRGNVQVAVRGAKRCMDHALDMEHSESFDIDISNGCYAAKERKEGVSQFAGRKPAHS